MSLKQRAPVGHSGGSQILAHPFEFVFGVYFIFAAFDFFFGHSVSSTSIAIGDLPGIVGVAWGLATLSGGTLVVLGLLGRSDSLFTRAIERAGLIGMAASWSALAVAIIGVSGGDNWLVALRLMLVVGGCLLRLYSMRRIEKVIAKIVRRQGVAP